VAVPGDLTIADGGYVCAVNAGQIAATSNINFSGTQAGYLLLSGNTVSVASLSSTSGGTVANNAGIAGMSNGQIIVNNAADSYYNGVILDNVSGSGTIALTKTGAGRLFLGGSSANTYTGGTTVSAGLLALQKSSGYAIPGNLTVDGPALVCVLAPNQIAPTSSLTFSGTQNGGLLLYGNTVTLANLNSTSGGSVGNTAGVLDKGNGTLVVNNAGDNYYNGVIYDNNSGSGTVALTKTGGGRLFLGGSSANTNTGLTTVSSGLLALQKTSGYAISGNIAIDSGTLCVLNPNQIVPTAALDFIGAQAGHFLLYGNTVTIANLNSTSGGNVGNTAGAVGPGNGTLIVNNAGDNYYNGVIYDNIAGGSGTVALTKTGGGRLFLGGSSANTNTGLTTVSNGLLALQKTSGYAISGNIAIDSGIICVLNPNQIVPTSAVGFTGAQAGALLLYGNTVTVTSLSSTSGGNVGNTAGAVGPGNGTLVVNNASNCSYYGAIYNNVAGGTGLTAVTKTGAGTLFLYGNNANNFTGGLTINQGIVDFENTENDVAHPYTVNSGGHLVLNGVQLAAAASAMSLIAASETDDYASAVPDTNNGTMSIVGSSYFNARNLAGTGTLMVQDNAVVYAHSLVQDTLVIGGTSSFSPAVAVPEPGTMILLAFAALAVAGVGIRRK
jgi:autotransporter-associated beta strand protein